MKSDTVKEKPETSRCHSYLVLGDWHRLKDSRAPLGAATGSPAGTGRLPGCRVYDVKTVEGAKGVLLNGERVQVGDRLVELIHAPVPATACVCYFCAEEEVLFCGDLLLQITQTAPYTPVYQQLLSRYCNLGLDAVFSAHEAPRLDASESVRRSLARARAELAGTGWPYTGLRPVIAIGTGGTLSMLGKQINREEILYV